MERAINCVEKVAKTLIKQGNFSNYYNEEDKIGGYLGRQIEVNNQ